ncbi:MAG: DUF4115 domain-containing protein [Alphaproteobacteria bacterium]|nr:DUF4115 domain-containing protein [Alphaproteobacteria bacterium]
MGIELEHFDKLGPFLQAAREAKGTTLAHAAKSLRIRQEYLEALESESFEKIPHPVYISGFLRSYSTYLGVDGNAVLEYFHLQSRTPKKQLTAHDLPVRTGRAGNATLILSVLAAILIYVVWYWLSHRAPSEPEEQVAEIPLHLRYLTEDDRPRDIDFDSAATRLQRNTSYLRSERSAPAWLDADTPLSWKFSQEMLKDISVVPSLKEVSKLFAAKKTDDAEEESGGEEETATDTCPFFPLMLRAFPDSGSITIDIRDKVWLQITTPGGHALQSRTFQPGETLVLPLGQGLTLDASEAKAINLRIGNAQLPQPNSPGRAVRAFPLDSVWLLQK